MSMCYIAKWSIENFLVCSKLAKKKLILPDFQNPSMPKPCKISLVDEKDDNDDEVLALLITKENVDTASNFKLKLTTSVLDVDGIKHFNNYAELLYPNDGLMAPDLLRIMYKRFLDTQKERFLPNGTLQIQIDFHFDYDTKCIVTTASSYLRIPSYPEPSDLSELCKDLEWLFKTGTYSDFEWNHGIKVHKAILSARSPVLAKMFRNKQVTELEQFQKCTVLTILMYMYTGHPSFATLMSVNCCAPFELNKAAINYQVSLIENRLSPPVVCLKTRCLYRSLDYTWVIENLNITDDFKGTLKSCKFCDTEKSPVTWCLILELGDSDVGIYLKREETVSGYQMPLFVEGSFSIINVDKEKCHYKHFKHMFMPEDLLIIECFVSKTMLRENEDILCPNNSLKIHCSLRGFNTSNNIIMSVQSFEISVVTDNFSNLSATTPDYKRLSQDLKSLYQSQELTDLILCTKDSEFKVHKCILAARCPGLRQVLLENINKEKIDLLDIETMILEILLLYVYSGELVQNLTDETAKEIYSAANSFRMPILMEKCMNFFISRLTVNNSSSTLERADRERCSVKRAAEEP